MQLEQLRNIHQVPKKIWKREAPETRTLMFAEV